jgi:four helix bundle protein
VTREAKKIGGYKDLLVWQKGIDLTRRVYEITRSLPSEERYGLVSQMRRAAVSIPSNIAEGQARHTTGEFIQFISHAEGSLAELETQIMVTIELGYRKSADVEGVLTVVEELKKMLNSLRRKLAKR